jgi:hypothetical protein
MHAASCWALHFEGEIVSTGPQDLARRDRRRSDVLSFYKRLAGSTVPWISFALWMVPTSF